MTIAIHTPKTLAERVADLKKTSSEADLAAAHLIAVRPEGNQLPENMAAIVVIATDAARRIRELEADRDAWESGERHLRRHLVKVLERLAGIHEAMVTSLLGEDGGQNLAELVADFGAELESERRNLG